MPCEVYKLNKSDTACHDDKSIDEKRRATMDISGNSTTPYMNAKEVKTTRCLTALPKDNRPNPSTRAEVVIDKGMQVVHLCERHRKVYGLSKM